MCGFRWLQIICLCSHLHLDCVVAHIIMQYEILSDVVFNIGLRRSGDFNGGERIRRAFKLLFQRLQVVIINVRIPEKIAKLVRDESAVMREQMSKQGVGQDVKRNT